MASGSAGSGWGCWVAWCLFSADIPCPVDFLPSPETYQPWHCQQFPGVLTGLSDLLDHLSEIELLDPSPALLLLCVPHSASWEHSPLLSAVQAIGFLAASTLSCLTYHQPAWQCRDLCKGVLQSHYLGLNPSSSECEPCDTGQITPSCLDFLTCTMGFKTPLIFIRLPSSDFGYWSTELLK